MHSIITVIPYSVGDASQAEKLLDWIYALSNKRQLEFCLLVAAHDVHEEMRVKIGIAAEVAFRSVDSIQIGPNTNTKPERVNFIFKSAAEFIHKTYQWPFLWLEPDCVPLVPSWFTKIEDAYFSQPKRYMGSHMKFNDKERVCMARLGCYPNEAINDLGGYCTQQVPFEYLVENAAQKTNKSKLFQQLTIRDENDFSKIREDAVLAHSDKTGSLIKHLRASIREKAVKV